ncbi:uncharacterized protein MONOS_17411 [Monocercomonoides exilis]|uniref:uncharacterized protein n=1 Tax=Monocercomonoides exilis TaxID=2049356 RepID=UPI00355A5CB1|nr:hypothetical protein MONOS_17411 [Monocercomonoides exilis]
MEFASSHVALVEPDSGLVEMVNCSFSSKHTEPAETRLQAQIPFHIIQIASGRCVLDGCCVADVALSVAAICIASPIQFVVCVFCNLATSDPLIDVTGSGEILRIIWNWRMSPSPKRTFFAVVLRREKKNET